MSLEHNFIVFLARLETTTIFITSRSCYYRRNRLDRLAPGAQNSGKKSV
jgi:hypothetical protein